MTTELTTVLTTELDQPEVETAPESAPGKSTPKEHPESSPTRSRARARAREGNATRPSRGRRLVAYFDPPELWTHRRPSLKDVWMYARHGEWTGVGTAGRVFGVAYALLVAIPAHVVLGWVLFLVERPGRAVTTTGLVVLLSLTPPGTWVRGGVAALLHAIAGLIT